MTFGSNARGEGELIYTNPAKWFLHPLYTNKSTLPSDKIKAQAIRASHDIALVKLMRKSQRMNDGVHYRVNTVCLPQSSQELKKIAADPATFFGWGLAGEEHSRWPIDTNALLKFNPNLESYWECPGQTICSEKYTEGQPRACSVNN